MNKAEHQSGVTLIETLVALAIMGLTVAAILVLIGQNTRFVASAEDRAFAAIAVDNLMVESLALEILERGEDSGVINVGDREWNYTRRVEDSPVAGLTVVEIDVGHENGQIVARATSLRGEP